MSHNPAKPLAALCLAALLGACGGGGGSGSGGGPAPEPEPPAPPPAEPYGLTSREPLAALNLPSTRVELGDYSLVDAFPRLDFDNALLVAAVPGEERLVVVQQDGRVYAFDDSPEADSRDTVLDLSGRVVFAGEQGLLGLAFDPRFPDNRYFYVHYSVEGPRRSVISRFTWPEGGAAAPASEKVILEVGQPYANHNGGMLAFGPDGYLYIALGDGGSGGDPLNHAQDRSTLLGALLRVDVHPADPEAPYALPPDNPLLDEPGARGEIYAWGLRNPFRFSFDRQGGDLWLGDVGQGDIEEIDRIASGGNYGWRVFEGSRRYDDSANTLPDSAFTPPVFEYDHSQGASVIGGYVYRGSATPSLYGRYLYADFVSGTIWALTLENGQVARNDAIASASRPTAFGETGDGEVLLVTRQHGLYTLRDSADSGTLPTRLSRTGLFSDLATLTPASGLVEYDVQHPFYSDGASKRRWVAIPDGETVTFDPEGSWRFPVGTVLVKHFSIDLVENDPTSNRRLETRLLIHTDDGWQGFTYRWDSEQRDARLLGGRESEMLSIRRADGGTREQRYDYPGRGDCLACHTGAAGSVLGLNAAQLNGDRDYGAVVDNQLRSWNHIGLFDVDIGDPGQYASHPRPGDGDASVERRARVYLDVNCSQCHRPGGDTGVELDLRHGTALADTGALDAPPQRGDLGVSGARIIAPGDRERSVLWLRMQRLDETRMPPLASHVVDEQGLETVGRWIDGLVMP